MIGHIRLLTETLAAPDAHSPEDWASLYGEQQIALGIWSIFLGCISLILYVPALRVFNRDKKHNCVRIMRFLALVDMLGILSCGILFGIQMIQGAVFCSHKLFVLVTCLTGYVCWNVSSLNCLFLVVNRILELTGKDYLFKGPRGASIMFGSAVYGIVNMSYTPPFLTNSRHQTVLLCPMIPGFDCGLYVNYVHQIHNTIFIITLLSMFIVFCTVVKSSKLNLNNSITTKNLQRIIFTQATIICGLNILGALVFILINYIYMPQLALLIGMIGYQLIHASPCLIYIVLNPTVRKELRKMFGFQSGAVQDNAAFTAASSSMSAA